MTRFRTILIMAAIAAFIVSGCSEKKDPSAKTPPPAKILAKVNGTTITEDDLRMNVLTGHGTGQETDKMRVLDDVIKAELLYQEAIKLGLDKQPAYARETEKLEKQLLNKKRSELVRRMYNTNIASRVDVTDQEAQDYFNKNIEQISAERRLGMLRFPTTEEAETVLKRIRGGESFKQVAEANMPKGTTPGPPKGTPAGGRPPWDMGFVSWSQLPVDFLDAVSKLKPGEVSDVVASQRAGIHIFTLIETRKNPKMDYNSVSGLIKMRLRDRKITEAYDAFINKLWKDAKIEKF